MLLWLRYLAVASAALCGFGCAVWLRLRCVAKAAIRQRPREFLASRDPGIFTVFFHGALST